VTENSGISIEGSTVTGSALATGNNARAVVRGSTASSVVSELRGSIAKLIEDGVDEPDVTLLVEAGQAIDDDNLQRAAKLLGRLSEAVACSAAGSAIFELLRRLA